VVYRSTRECLNDLDKRGELIRLKKEIDPYLDIAELTRRIHDVQGPALLFEHVKGSSFPVASNIFGTKDRAHYIFQKTLPPLRKAIELRADPRTFFKDYKNLWSLPSLAMTAFCGLPKRSLRRSPVLWKETSISQLPQCVSWPEDGGAFLTLPQVLSLMPGDRSLLKSNLGMYRIQLSGGEYDMDKEVGLHYQLHRGIGIHHTKAKALKKPWKVSIFVGGPPSHTIAAVMPMPEGLSEVIIAGMLAGRGLRWSRWRGYPILSDADFCILGEVNLERLKPEGPFGDHLGYYSLRHDFPFLKVEHVFCRRDAIMPITVVGRPPQEDSVFGALIHQLTKPMISVHLPGVKEVHAVDDAGVHPLLLAIGSERYVPYKKRVPMEVITQGFSILGFNQCSLAKYLFIAACEDDEHLSCQDIPAFFTHVLERVDWQRDLHLLTSTPIDTLDYSSGTLNAGSKLMVVCAGEKKRRLSASIPQRLSAVRDHCIVIPGLLAITLETPPDSVNTQEDTQEDTKTVLYQAINSLDPKLWHEVAMVVVSDDARELGKNFRRFLWETFTRSHPADDIHGKNERYLRRHLIFDGPLFIDARSKHHMPRELKPDPASKRRVDAYVSDDPSLQKWLR